MMVRGLPVFIRNQFLGNIALSSNIFVLNWQSMRALGGSIGPGHPLRPHMDVIESKVPTELLDRVRRHPPPDSPHADVPSEKALVRLHKQVNLIFGTI